MSPRLSATDPNSAVKVVETTPLLPRESPKPANWPNSVLYRALLCGFLVTLSFGVTQVPLIYVFRLMTCEAYYETHSEPAPGTDRCSNREIEAGTSRAVALLGFSTTAFGVINLFITGWTIRKLGIKTALLIQVFWPAVRLATQNFGVMTGGANGIIIIQCSQIITIIGGPSGYLLSLNSFIAEITENRERTGALGRLQGCSMFGMAFGYLLGGLLSDKFGIIAPFRVTLALFLISSLYVLLFLPQLPKTTTVATQSSSGFARFFGPLKTFAPRKWVLPNGRVQRQYGPLLLGIGVFLGVLATGYIPVLLQMYSTETFKFGTTENGYLISLYSLTRGLFLTLAFPKIISAGREWISSQKKLKDWPGSFQTPSTPECPPAEAAVQAMENDEEPPVQPKRDDDEETFAFDLIFTRYSLIADGILTGAASFAAQGWQLYLIAMFLPFASGTGAAAKGTILQMCSAAERADALSGIAFVEMMARLSTTSVFGLVYAALAGIGQTHLVFICNAGVALIGFCVLLFSRFPPDGSKRLVEGAGETPQTP